MEKENPIKAFFSSVVASLCSFTTKQPPQHPDLEMQAPPIPHVTPDNMKHDEQQRDYDLAKIILCFSFPAAIALLVLSHQTQPHLHSSFHLLSFVVWLAFSASLVGILLYPRFPPASKVMVHLGIVSAAIAFCLLMAILLPTFLESIAWSFCVLLSFWFFYVLYKLIYG